MSTTSLPENEGPTTFFASPERLDGAELAREISALGESEIVSAILRCAGGSAVVVNAHRQIVAANHAYLALAGLADPADTLGLRPGESVVCVHSRDGAPSGCGTAVPCASCGLAVAVVLSQRSCSQQTAECALRFGDPEHPAELSLGVQAFPVHVQNEHYTLVLLRDISEEKRRAAMEAAFRHDLKNVAMGLSGTAEILAMTQFDEETAVLARDVQSLAMRLTAELEIHAAVSTDRPLAMPVRRKKVRVESIFFELNRLLAHHPASTGKAIELATAAEPIDFFETDPVLLQRVLLNFALNALEASADGDAIRLGAEPCGDGVRLTVWNRAPIPTPVRQRIFQRYFSTKEGAARGHGTYAARLIGETYLKGRVGFTTSDDGGTSFFLELPSG